MKQATPEQIEQVRHIRKVMVTVWLTAMGCFFAFMMIRYLFDLHLSPFWARLVSYGVIGGGIGLVIFSIVYDRCPVCKSPFTRQTGHKYCEKCGTKYDA